MSNRAEPSIHDLNLDRGPANFRPLSPIDYLRWSADVFADRVAIIDGARRFSYGEMANRCRRLASALNRRGAGRGDTVSIIAANRTAMLEAHFGIPMSGAVINALNFRLDAASIAFILEHAETKILLVDALFADTVREALQRTSVRPLLVDIDSEDGGAAGLGGITYEELLEEGDADHPWRLPEDEWDAISLCYTSGTTGNPKGVVYHHRGAHLNALGNAFAFGLDSRSVYLWTLPMFHCNGWTYTWGVTAAGATHVCLPQMRPAEVFRLIEKEQVTHMCGAPIVLNMLIHAPQEEKRPLPHRVEVATGGAAPPGAVLEAMETMGFHVTHLYGLSETYGPSTICVPQEDWSALSPGERAAKIARQGVRYPTLGESRVADPETGIDVPRDGESMGELLLRGHTVMKGYLKNPKATGEALRDGWFHTGDLAVCHEDGYVEVKDRSKDIIISGGENISSLEVEEILYRHPDIMEAAVVAKADAQWGETPCAFVTLRPGVDGISAEAVIEWCRANMARYKVPRHVIFGPLPKTSTGKVQKFTLRERASGSGD
ncbi:MAG: AMP-binding protein [Geminicoccaceae bacterium]|nr:AMP-binding protein [Geminicoccaceae bacterium]